MVDDEAGKGDKYRPVDKKKNYLRIFGNKNCICKGTGWLEDEWIDGEGKKHKCKTRCMLCNKGDKK